MFCYSVITLNQHPQAQLRLDTPGLSCEGLATVSRLAQEDLSFRFPMSRPSPLTRDGGAMTAAQSAVTLAVCVLMVTELILAKKDYYEILGVHREANERQIKKAFHKLAMKYHPDKNSSPDAEDRFREIAEAYETLSDDNSRQEYDQFDGSAAYFARETQAGQRHGPHQPFSFNFDDIFKDFDIYSQNRHASHRRNFNEHSRSAKESHSRHKRHFQGGFHDMFDDLERMFVFGKQAKQTENGFHGASKQHCRTVTERKGNMVTTYTECNVT